MDTPSDTATSFTRGQRLGHWLLIVVVALVFAAALYYALMLIRSTTFSTDRGFRVLEESVGQFDNLQDSMASLLKLVPSIPACEGLRPQQRTACIRSNYQARLDMPDLRLEDRPEDKAFTSCTQRRREEFLLRLDERYVGFSIYPCSVAAEEPGSKYVLRGSLVRGLERFNSLMFFEETVFALKDGAVLAELTPPRASRGPGTRLQDTSVPDLGVADASHLLQRAALAAANASREDGGKDAAQTDRKVQAHPVVFSDTLAGQRYRVFVVAFRPAYPLYSVSDATATPQREDFVYLIGLKRERLATALAYALWPNGTFAITLTALLAMLCWPLASLRLSAPQDPISRGEALAIMTSLLLIPALLTIAVVWAWSHRTLQAWADEGAEVYAEDVERLLVKDLQASAGLLDEYRKRIYMAHATPCMAEAAGKGDCLAGAMLPLRPDERAGAAAGTWVSVPTTPDPDVPPDCCSSYYLWISRSEQPLGSWSPLRTAVALDETGEKIGPRLSAFGAVPQRRTLNLADRAYFETLRNGDGWHLGESAGFWIRPPQYGVVAQRLFSRADAARTLQVAVPRCAVSEVFCGIVTGDSRVHALTAKVDPPLLRFAVIDRDGGTVLFHSDDTRSLSENFFTETEHDAELQAALRLGQATHFSGRYVGDPHRFYFRPMQGVPWSVIVFYPSKALGDLPLQAGVAALTAYAGIALMLLTVIAAVLFSETDIARRTLAWLWPQWGRRLTYRWLGWVGLIAAALAMLVGFVSLRTGFGYLALVAAIIVVAMSVWMLRRHAHSSAASTMSVRSYERAYIRCLVSVLFFVSALPAAWLGLDYHDAQVQGLLREAAQRAAADIERRHALIAHDLQRWVPDARARIERYPDPWTLTEAAVPGYDIKGGLWTLHVFQTVPWARIAGPKSLGPWRRQAWGAAAQSADQLRRIGLLGPAGAALISPCTGNESRECYRANASDAHPLTIATPIVLETAVRRAPNERFTMPLSIAGVGVFLVSLWLAALVARRYLGVGLPFAGRYLREVSTEDDAGATLQRVSAQSLHEVRLLLDELRERHPHELTDKDRDDYLAVNADAHYHRIWKLCTRDECLLLHQLATGRFANPANHKVTERLIRAGLVVLDPWPRHTDAGFSRFVRTAETRHDFTEWQRAASRSVWRTVKTPLLIGLLLVVGWLVWSAGDYVQAFSAILVAAIALFGQVGQVVNLVRGSVGQKSG